MIFELAQDFRDAVAAMPVNHPRYHLLKLFEEAICRDTHFIARHPTTLFQCMWNTCWWYDCPEAAQHYEEPQEGWGNMPWNGSRPRLHEILTAWRTEKERLTAGFLWIRSMQPPRNPLGTKQHAVLCGHEGMVSCVAFSRDGSQIASTSYDQRQVPRHMRDHSVRVWDFQSGKQIQCLSGHPYGILAVALSPDGMRIATTGVGSADATVRIWDVQNGTELLCLRGHGANVTGVVFSPDGFRVVSVSQDNTVRIWDVESGKQKICIPRLRRRRLLISSVDVSPDGKQLVTGGADGIRVWNSKTGRLMMAGNYPADKVVWSPDGAVIFSLMEEKHAMTGSLSAWTRPTLNSAWERFRNRYFRKALCCGYKRDIKADCLACSPDGKILAVGAGRTIILLNAESGAAIQYFHGHSDVVTSVAFRQDGRFLISGSVDKTVRIWKLTGKYEHKSTIFRRLCDNSLSDKTSMCDTHDRKALILREALRGLKPHEVEVAVLSPSEKQVAIGTRSWEIQILDVYTRITIWKQTLPPIRFSENSKYIPMGNVLSIVYAPDEKHIAVASYNRCVVIYNTESDLLPVFCGLTRCDPPIVKGLCFSPDSRRIVGYAPGQTCIWDAETGILLDVLPGVCDNEVIAAGATRAQTYAVSQPMETVIALTESGQATGWFPTSYSQIKTCPDGHTWTGAEESHPPGQRSHQYIDMLTLEGVISLSEEYRI